MVLEGVLLVKCLHWQQRNQVYLAKAKTFLANQKGRRLWIAGILAVEGMD